MHSSQINQVEGELSNEVKKNGELSTRCAKAEKRAKEMSYQLEEEMKNVQVLQDQIMSLNSKVKKLRENLGDAVSDNSFSLCFQ